MANELHHVAPSVPAPEAPGADHVHATPHQRDQAELRAADTNRPAPAAEVEPEVYFAHG